MPRSKEPAPHFPKVTIAGMPDWWKLLDRGRTMENIPAIKKREQRRINREIEHETDARLDILADHLSIPRGDYKALATALAAKQFKDFAVKATSVASRGRHAEQKRFAIVTKVDLCRLSNAVDGKEISVKKATRLLAANPELKTGQADALEAKYYKCLRELEEHPKTLRTLDLFREFRPAMLEDPETRTRVEDDLSRIEDDCFPVHVKK
jgi:hypothetical protein